MQTTTVHTHHETSVWPMIVGCGVLLTAMSLLTYYAWQKPSLGIVLGGITLALIAIGVTGWARECFTHGHDEKLGPIAVAAFIVSEVIIFGTVFAAFWLARISHFDEWKTFVPAGLDIGFAVWLTLILWASSITVLLSEHAMAKGNRGGAIMWLVATLALGTLFVVLHMNEWSRLVGEGFKVGANAYANSFYGLTGVHTSHVLVGLGMLLLLLYTMTSGLMTKDRMTLFAGASLYWHFVDLMWLLVAGNAYLIGGLS
jgi:cytochrome c oxidase subunit III